MILMKEDDLLNRKKRKVGIITWGGKGRNAYERANIVIVMRRIKYFMNIRIVK